MRRFRLVRSLVLALVLVSAQLLSITHAVGHALEHAHHEGVHHEDEQPAEHQETCDQCHACAELGSSPPPSFSLPAPQITASAPVWLPLTHGIYARPPDYFHSRAPPSL